MNKRQKKRTLKSFVTELETVGKKVFSLLLSAKHQFSKTEISLELEHTIQL